MYLRRLTALFLAIGLLAGSSFAQITPEQQAERAKKAKEIDEQIVAILDRTIGEIGGLRLAQNRVVIYALAGDIYWRYDPKRARELFRSGAGELINYHADTERERAENRALGVQETFDPFDPRFEFLNLVGMRDAELGLELMNQSRPASIADAMAKNTQTAAATAAGFGVGTGPGQGFDPDRSKAMQESSLEQSLTMRAAANDPEKAAKAVRDSLAKGVSTNVMGLLQQIIQKDEKLAATLGGEVIAKLTGSDLARSQEDLNGAINFMSYMARPVQPQTTGTVKIFSFTEAQIREAALKVASIFLQPGTPAFVNNALSRALPSLEKLVPDKAFLLKQKDAANKRTAAAPRPGQPRAAQTWNPNDTPEAIIAAAAKLADPRLKTQAYQAASNKIPQISDEARAKRLIDSIADERIRSQARDRFEANRINRLSAEGKLEEAKASVATLANRHMQVQRLVQLAMQFQRRGTPKDVEAAAAIMAEARMLVNPIPEDEEELGAIMELVRGYAVVEPDAAFRMIEPFIDEFNDMVQAGAVLTRYNKRDRTFRKGEMVMRINGGIGGSILAFRFVPHIQELARADVERMSTLADRFQRSDARTLMKLYVLQGYQRGRGVLTR